MAVSKTRPKALLGPPRVQCVTSDAHKIEAYPSTAFRGAGEAYESNVAEPIIEASGFQSCSMTTSIGILE